MKTKSFNKYSILFISTNQSFFIDTHTNFLRLYNQILSFHKNKKFNVIILQPSFDKKKEKSIYKKDFKIYYFKQIKFLWYTLCPFTDFNPFFFLKVLKIIKKHKIDLIHVEFPFGINILKLITNLPISYNSHNVESLYTNQIGKYDQKIPNFLRFLYSKFIFFIEKYALKLSTNINTVSYVDKNNFHNLYKIPTKKMFVNTRGYDKSISNNPLEKEIAKKKLEINNNKFVIIFHGSNSLPNQEALEIIKFKIAPKIKDKNVLFLIAGSLPKFRNEKNLRHLGFVDDLKYFLYSGDIAISPIVRGTGIKTRILDYFAANIPIISTRKGIEGIIFKDGKHGYIVDNLVDAFIEKILELKNNPLKLKDFKKNIKDLAENYYDWDVILNKLNKRYEFLIKINK